jgi:hypothetical protein
MTSRSGRLESGLWEAAVRTAFALGFEFAPDGERHFKAVIDSASPKIVDRAVRDDNALPAALRAVEQLVFEMVNVAKSLGLQRLDELTASEALRKVCPLWPFC